MDDLWQEPDSASPFEQWPDKEQHDAEAGENGEDSHEPRVEEGETVEENEASGIEKREWDWAEETVETQEGDPQDVESEETGLREQLLDHFAELLDQALSKDKPEGIAEEIWKALDTEESDEPDLYSLWSGMTTLTQEIKLQGRAFKQLGETLTPVGDISAQLPDVLRAHDEALATAHALEQDQKESQDQQRHQQQKSLENMMRKDFFDLLLDLRDRLKRGLEAVQGQNQSDALPTAGALAKMFAAPQIEAAKRMSATVEAMHKGYMLTLERLDESLQSLGINEILCKGQTFDATRMNAVDIEQTNAVPDGQVLEVYRAGYEWNDALLRTAEVKVARKP